MAEPTVCGAIRPGTERYPLTCTLRVGHESRRHYCAQVWWDATLDAERARPDALREDSVWTTDVNGDPVNLIAHIVKAHGIDLADSGCSYCAKAAALAGKEPTDG